MGATKARARKRAAIAAARAKAAAAAKGATLRKRKTSGPTTRQRSPKGKLFPSSKLATPKIQRAFADAVVKHGVTPADVGATSQADFEAKVRQAAELVLAKGRLTPTGWIGKYNELASPGVWGQEEIRLWHRNRLDVLVKFRFREARMRGRPPEGFVDVGGRKVLVKSHFTKESREIKDVRISHDGVALGDEYCDRMMLNLNDEGLSMPSGQEYKTRASAKDLPAQIARFYKRLRAQANNPNAVLTYTDSDGKPGRIPIRNLVLLERSKLVDFYSRIGVVAGRTRELKVAEDIDGNPYLRVTAKLPGMRALLRVFEEVHKQL